MSLESAQGAFIRAADGRIFTLYQPPCGGFGRDDAVLLCYPGMHEMMRAQFAFRQLAGQLASGGWPVLRFDYYGTGDSEGETGAVDLDTAVRDGVAAACHLLRESGARRLTVVGLRLGAMVAARIARDIPTTTLILWDPPATGAEYLAQCQSAQRQMNAFNRFQMIAASDGPGEVLGSPLGARLERQILAFDWSLYRPRSPFRHVVETSASEMDWVRLGFQAHTADEPAGWGDFAQTRRALLAPRAIKKVMEIIARPEHD